MEVSKVEVIRKPSEKDWTLSEFFFDGVRRGVGVEDERREIKVKGETRIDEGEYYFDLRFSPKFSNSYFRDDQGNIISAKERVNPELIRKYHTAHEMLWVRDPLNFQFILWHWGNTDDDTEGCYIVGSVIGKVQGQDGVINSRKKYTDIYPILWRSVQEAKKTGKKVKVIYK